MLSHKVTEPKVSFSKWIKSQVLLDADEMEACFNAVSPFELYNTCSIAAFEELTITHSTFLEAYKKYVHSLREGELSEPDRKLFSAVMTVDPEAVYAKELQPGRWMAKLARPVVQLQNHRFFASNLDHKIHPMVMSPDSIQWGVQFAFPQIFFDGSSGSYKKTSDEKQFSNAAVFGKLLKWLRSESYPTTFVWDGQKVASPIRLGKQCFKWIANHPQLKKQGIKVHVY